MSNNSGNFNYNSNLPSNVEGDHPTYGNFCATHTRVINNYTSAHPIAIGSSTFSRAGPPRQQDFDEAPQPNIYETFKEEVKRLATFNDWPSYAPVKKDDLAHNGFIYLHVTDRTQCVFCRGILSNWETGDVVENEHKRNCPECPFAFGYECGNRPILRQVLGETLQPQQPAPQSTYNTTVQIPATPATAQNTYQHTYHIVRNAPGEDVVGRVQNRTPVPPQDNRSDASGSFSNGNYQVEQLPSIPPQQQSLSVSNVSRSDVPKYPQWENEQLRVQSYMGWPAQMSQKPLDLAHAGLLYMATGDRCKCYWCGGELYEWEPLDDPMEEHAKWFSECNYIRRLKGDDYIQYVKDKQNGLIVEPSEFMTNPHVLAVLQLGYTREQVQEVIRLYGVTKLQNAVELRNAIDETTRERQARLQQMNSHNTTQHTTQPQQVSFTALDDDDVSMELEESEINPPGQTNMNDSLSGGQRDRLVTQTQINSAESSSSKQTVDKDKDVDTVFQENEKLKDQKLCKICMDRDLCVTFLPCSHLVTCAECSVNLQECPVCRKKIQQKVRVYWS